MNNKLFIERSMMLAIFGYPVVMLLLKGWLSALFILICIFSVTFLVNKKNQGQSIYFDKNARSYAFAMTSVLMVTLFSQIYNEDFYIADWDSPVRFFLAIPVYLALRSSSRSLMQPLQYGLPVGAVVALLVALLASNMDLQLFGGRATNYYLNPIHFGNLALMLGLLSVASINWFGCDSRNLVVLKSIGLLAGVIASIMSGTRGGWVAIPVILIARTLIEGKYSIKKLLAWGGGAICVITLGYFSSSTIQQRSNYSLYEIQSIGSGNFDSALGQRIQIWKGATQIFLENPVVGVGPNGFKDAILALGESGYITKLGAEQGVNEVHSQLFASLAKLGILGFISYLLVHFVPLAMFLKSMKSRDAVEKNAALMGVSLVIGFLVFSLTVEMYNLKMVATFYSLSVAVLLAACNNTYPNEVSTQASPDKELKHV